MARDIRFPRTPQKSSQRRKQKASDERPDLEAIRRRILKKLRAERQKAKRDARAEQTPNAHSPSNGESVEPIRYRRDIPHLEPRQASMEEEPSGDPIALEEALSGVETPASPDGQAYLITERVLDIDEAFGVLNEQFERTFSEADSPLSSHLAFLSEDSATRPEDLLFLDLETAGLSNAPLFLIGAMTWDDGEFVVRQYLARDYSEERPALALFADMARERDIYVSFNGKSFDVPFLRTRAALHHVAFSEAAGHLDLLHVSRRFWKHQLPNCKLQTLEKYVCNRTRHGDIPGREIPEAYHAFVRTGDARQMLNILRHNMLDLITLADLMTRFPRP